MCRESIGFVHRIGEWPSSFSLGGLADCSQKQALNDEYLFMGRFTFPIFIGNGVITLCAKKLFGEQTEKRRMELLFSDTSNDSEVHSNFCKLGRK